jgi:DNA-binding GntR family transcriptional regulator
MPPTFPKIEPVSKKVRVVALVREAIISGKIQAGEQIVEAKLAQQFGVGQGLIREALIDLEHHGFVQRTPFSGTQVSKLTLDDARQIFDLRIELEPLAFFLAGERAATGDLDGLLDLAEKTRAASTAEDVFAFFEHHLSFRKKVWGLSGNRYLCQSLERIVVPLYALYLIRRTYNSEGIVQTMVECVEHQDQLLQAYRSGDLEEVRKVARKFLVKMKGYLGSRL